MPESQGLAHSTVRGTTITLLARTASAALSYLLQLVLAYLLTPSDFGVFALASTVVALFSVFRDGGAGRVLLQRRKDFWRFADTTFWAVLITSTVCALMVVVCASLAARLYGDPLVEDLLVVMSVGFPITAITLLSHTRLMLDMQWKALGFVELSVTVIKVLLALAMASVGFGVYALVIPIIVSDLCRAFLLARMSGVSPKCQFRLCVAREIFGPSVFVLGKSTLLTMRRQGDYIILGLLNTATGTGIYFLAYELSGKVLRLFLSSLSPILFSVFTAMEENPKREYQAFTRALHIVAMVVIPICLAQTSLAIPIFRLMFKPEWQVGALPFGILSIVCLVHMFDGLSIQIWEARGQFRSTFLFSLLFTPFEICVFVLGALIAGVNGVALGALVSAIIGWIAWHRMVFARLKYSWRYTYGPIWRAILASAPMVSLAILLPIMFPSSRLFDALAILITLTVGGIAYCFLVSRLWAEPWKEICQQVEYVRQEARQKSEIQIMSNVQ